MESVTPLSSSSEESPNWLDLPPEVTAAILQKIDVIDILNHVQLVCTSWHTIYKDPSMWRSIVMLSGRGLHKWFDVEKMARHAVDRSCGQLVDISIGHLPTDGFIHFLAQSSCQIRRLEIVSCTRFSRDLLKETASKFPMLEELKVQSTVLSIDAIEAIGRCCPQLKTFKYNVFKYHLPLAYHENLVKMIAKTMPKLNHLELLRTKITNAGLKSILDGCTFLETLDLGSSYLCNLQVDDLGEAYSARFKKITRYHEEPAAVYIYEHERKCYGDDPFSDEDVGWDYNDDDEMMRRIRMMLMRPIVVDDDDVDDFFDDDDENEVVDDEEGGTHEQW
ncbi:unnamed protein product [Rhodiola kirilowii]